MGGIRRGRLVVFVGFGPRSQQNIRRLSLMIEKLKGHYEVSIIHVPDDVTEELPYVRIEPLDPSAAPPREADLVCDMESKV